MRTIEVLARKATKSVTLPLGIHDRRRPGDVVVLLYHRVDAGSSEIDLPVQTFERQVAELARRGDVLSLDRALDGEEGGVVVTFDDGSRDFHANVLPVLARHRVPATLYLATGFVSGDDRPADPPDGWDPLTWSQLEEAVSTGLVTIGSHTHRHANLARASAGEAEDEMKRSKGLIEDRLGRACRHFAYPWGVASPEADRLARRLFESAALDAWRTNRRGAIDPHNLGRVPVLRSDGWVSFRAKTKGLLNGERLVYRALRRGPWGQG